MNGLTTCAWIDTFSAETGSAQTIRLWAPARARAMPIRARGACLVKPPMRR
jgi:hypothetical protein